MADGARQYVLRARFQPFCRDHYEAILSFFLEFARGEEEEDPPHLHLWVVRHFKTVANRAGVDLVTGDDNELFRHLAYFNPLQLDECITGIRRGIRDYVDADRANDLDSAECQEALDAFLMWSATHLHTCPVRISVKEMGAFWGTNPYTATIPDIAGSATVPPGFVMGSSGSFRRIF